MNSSNPLDQVLTIPEVARMWCKHQNTVRLALGARRRPLKFRETGRVILIDAASCRQRWGEPVK